MSEQGERYRVELWLSGEEGSPFTWVVVEGPPTGASVICECGWQEDSEARANLVCAALNAQAERDALLKRRVARLLAHELRKSLREMRQVLSDNRKAREVKPAQFVEVHFSACHAGGDGDCFWAECPQERDGEPLATGRHCPLDHVPTEGWTREKGER